MEKVALAVLADESIVLRFDLSRLTEFEASAGLLGLPAFSTLNSPDGSPRDVRLVFCIVHTWYWVGFVHATIGLGNHTFAQDDIFIRLLPILLEDRNRPVRRGSDW